ncbi:MAG: hypothetical protein LiPW16_138 [Microgenomates group bacterium LiPW_16]|nr:MAG: hypothetical protein LiPW16_138 [Microgenomates group bacterium LiPW_16]
MILAVAVIVIAIGLGVWYFSTQEELPGRLLKIEANPAKGFHWAYYLYIPGRVWTGEDGQTYLLVEPNNSPEPSDDLSHHDNLAREIFEFHAKMIAEELKVPFLMPVFPRPWAMGAKDESSYGLIVTHALDRDTLLIEIEELKRIDLQLITMIDNAKEQLAQKGINIENKVLMMGYSSAGDFTNRFAMLHPERVRAAAAGGVGGWDTVPLKEWNGIKLRYPIGVWDFKNLVGKEFDLETWKTIPLYIYAGDEDTNDPVPISDMYDPEDTQLILQNFGESITGRWRVREDMFKSVGSQARFVLYPGMAHELTDEELEETFHDVRNFFSEQMAHSSD